MYAELTDLLEKLKNEDDDYIKYDILSDIDSIISSAKFDISHDSISGNSYYNIISTIMMKDIATYLENYKNENKLPGYEYYEIRVWKSAHGSARLMCSMPFRGQINTKGLIRELNGFQKYNVLLLLGLNKDMSIVSETDCIRFSKLREEDNLYFLKLNNVKNIIKMMHEIIE